MIPSELREPDPRHVLGLRGEELAEEALKRAGLRILDRRFRVRQGEIDLVAEEAGVLVFVEVKTRSSPSHAQPWEAVILRKQKRIIRAALAYLARRGGFERPCRFDVVEVLREGAGPGRVRHIRDAFRPRAERDGV